MTNKQIFEWIKSNKLRPERAASVFGISLSTLFIAKRGAGFTEETLEKVIKAIRDYDATKLTQKAG